MSCVMPAANTMCHVVKKRATWFVNIGVSLENQTLSTYEILDDNRLAQVQVNPKSSGALLNLAVERIHLLKRMTLELRAIHKLSILVSKSCLLHNMRKLRTQYIWMDGHLCSSGEPPSQARAISRGTPSRHRILGDSPLLDVLCRGFQGKRWFLTDICSGQTRSW